MRAGVGPKPIPVDKLRTHRLAEAIRAMTAPGVGPFLVCVNQTPCTPRPPCTPGITSMGASPGPGPELLPVVWTRDYCRRLRDAAVACSHYPGLRADNGVSAKCCASPGAPSTLLAWGLNGPSGSGLAPMVGKTRPIERRCTALSPHCVGGAIRSCVSWLGVLNR